MAWSRRRSALFARGEPMVWLTGGALMLSLCMIVGLLVLVLIQGMSTFWPTEVVRIETTDGKIRMGEVTRAENFEPADREGTFRRRLVRTGNFELTGSHFHWVSDFDVKEESRPEWVIVTERLAWGRFYGIPKEFLVDGRPTATGDPAKVWEQYEKHHGDCRARWREIEDLKKHDLGALNHEREESRLSIRQAELDHGPGSAEVREAQSEHAAVVADVEAKSRVLQEQIRALEQENARFVLVCSTSGGQDKQLNVADIVRAYPANQLGTGAKLGVYFSRWREYLFDDPREANSEGGVYPAIFGTVIMVLIMTVLVVPFGVLAALYLREYAKQGVLVSIVRIAVNNLAGVPSIVFGVFGLGFFCYVIGSGIDELLFEARLPNPTYGKAGLMWASLTLALLTLPVVIVATEEALAAVPRSMREGSYACGASKWQTIRRIVLPRAMPGIMTGTILAIARGAGEVAPLMLVGAVKLAPELPIDGTFPYVHPERSFMHLGFHIYDLGFQSQNSEAAKPMVFTTTLLLIGIVVTLNVLAIWVRARLRRAMHA
jgi:phosphate transport system permease protein